MNPRISQDEMQQIYKSSEYWNEIGYKDYLAGEAIRIENSETRWNFCSRFLPERGRLLDVGCATGFFEAVAARHCFEVVGIDGAGRHDCLREEDVRARSASVHARSMHA
jgi:2-polyprenyl-3-methyl-5-hydroxy-6-metoxy-1,4-benzoquinol methylase